VTGYSRAQLLHLYKQGRLRGHKNGEHVFLPGGRSADDPEWRAVVVAPKATLGWWGSAGRCATPGGTV